MFFSENVFEDVSYLDLRSVPEDAIPHIHLLHPLRANGAEVAAAGPGVGAQRAARRVPLHGHEVARAGGAEANVDPLVLVCVLHPRRHALPDPQRVWVGQRCEQYRLNQYLEGGVSHLLTFCLLNTCKEFTKYYELYFVSCVLNQTDKIQFVVLSKFFVSI